MQTFVHNMEECKQLECTCRHVHDKDEWTPSRRESAVYYPTKEEAEYSAALAWSMGMCIMQHFYKKGRVKMAIPSVPMLYNETGDRTKWKRYPPHLTRGSAMIATGLRLGYQPNGLSVRLQSTVDPDYMLGRKTILEHELYIGNGNAKLKWQPSEWSIEQATSTNNAEVRVLDFALKAEQPHTTMMLRKALTGKTVILCDCRRGWPCHGEVFVELANRMGGGSRPAEERAQGVEGKEEDQKQEERWPFPPIVNVGGSIHELSSSWSGGQVPIPTHLLDARSH